MLIVLSLVNFSDGIGLTSYEDGTGELWIYAMFFSAFLKTVTQYTFSYLQGLEAKVINSSVWSTVPFTLHTPKNFVLIYIN